ncbi:MAG: ATP-binding cassette domain-containing protein [Woeseiaceae bacterium]|nr:ATP-binding cassette domain-containing protein [Woeseiaceae bacterium]
MTEPPLIEFHNATIWRGTTRVFDRLNLSIAQHERVAILGPNGSGKTTLLKTITRELYPVVRDDAWVRILGRTQWNVWDLRRHIGVVSPDLERRYTSHTTALEVVVSGYHSSIGVHGTLARRVTAGQRQRAAAVLDALGIGALAGTPLGSMSTGERRRCLLGRALVHEPRTLVLDEPTAGLDLAAAFTYLATLRELTATGHDIVIVTHHLNEIPPEIGRVIVLDRGRIVADGPRSAVLTGELLSAVYRTPVAVARVDGYYLAYPGLQKEQCAKT